MTSQMDDVISILRSCLLTSKAETTLDQLNRDYEAIEGEHIPFKKLGYKNLHEFLKNVPNLLIYSKNGSIFVEAIATSEIAHITFMMSKQKNNNKKKRKPIDPTYGFQRRPNAFISSNNYNQCTTSYTTIHTSRTAPTVKRTNSSTANSRTMLSESDLSVDKKTSLEAVTSKKNISVSPVIVSNCKDAVYYQPPQARINTFPVQNRPLSERLVIKPTLVIKQSDDPRVQLENLTHKLKLPNPLYKIFPRTKSQRIGDHEYYCKVTVGVHTAHSSPTAAKTSVEAEKLAANILLQTFMELHVQLHVTTDKKLIRQRVIEIADEHPGGMIEPEVPGYYQSKYHETLPQNWANIVAEFPMDLTFEKNATGESFILYRFDPAIHQMKNVHENILSFIGNPVPSKIVYPTDDYWPVYITHVVSTNEIWVTIIGSNYNDLHHSMFLEISKSYESKQPVNTVSVDRYYIAKDDDNWQRIRVQSVDISNNTVEAFFIDTGHYESLSCKLLYPFENRFYEVPSQAIRLSLAGLEDLADYDKATNATIEALLFNRCYVNIVANEVDNDEYTALSAIFYDTSGDNDIVVNDVIQETLINKFQPPNLTIKNGICEVFISHVGIKGNIYVHLKNEGLQLLDNLLKKVSLLAQEALKVSKPSYIDMNEVYLVQGENGNWLRVKPVSTKDHRIFEMLLIDFGGTLNVDMSKLLLMSKLFPILYQFPPQAFHVRLHNIEASAFNETLINRLITLAPHNMVLLCKVISEISQPLLVELFKRSQPENALISINNTLSLIPELENSNQDGNNNVNQSKKRVERGIFKTTYSESCLRGPEISSGKLYKVNVTNLVASPSNFFIQPRDQANELMIMMKSMQDCYNNYNDGTKLSMEFLKEGKLCAAKYNKKWYRAYINRVTDPHMVIVYLCDYGHIIHISIDDLLPLKSQFFQLRYQAIKARLNGIIPKNVDWQPDSCTLFKELVADKEMIAKVCCVEKDETWPTNLIVSIELIDTSTNKDIKIHEILVNTNHAIFISSN